MSGCDITDRVKKLLRQAAQHLYDSGMVDGDKIIDTIHDDLKDHSPMTRGQIADGIAGIGGARKAREGDLGAHFRDLVAELKDLRKTQDRLSGQGDNGAADAREQTRLRNRIADLQRRIEYRDFNKPEKDSPEYNEQTQALRAEHDELKKQFEQSEPSPPATRPEDPSVKYNARRIKAVEKQIADVKDRMARGDFTPDTKAKFNYRETPELYQAIKDRDSLIRKYENQKYLARQKNQSPAARTADLAFRTYRAIILSSTNVLGKLGAATTLRILGTPLERLIGSGLKAAGHIPFLGGLKRIYEKAPSQGAGFVPSIEAAAFRKTFGSKETGTDLEQFGSTLGEMASQLKQGRDFIDAFTGAKDVGYHGKLEMVGQVHAMLKEPAKLNEFYRSFLNRMEFEKQRLMREEGMTREQATDKVNEPQTHDAIFAQSAADAYATIFQNDNMAVSLYRTIVARLMNAGEKGTVKHAVGQVMGRAAEFAFPIVKVPTNLVAEVGSYLAGGVKAAAQIVFAKGTKNLTGEQADYVARNLQKQTIGAAMMAIGALGYESIGGYHQPGDNKRNRKIEADTAEIDGHTVPRFLFHTPVMQMMQLGATFARVYHEDRHGTRWNEAEKEGNAAMQAFKGLVDQVPFISAPWNWQMDVKDVESVERAAGRGVRGLIEPPDLQRYAKSQDTGPRKPHGFWDEIKMGLPWLREEVPRG